MFLEFGWLDYFFEYVSFFSSAFTLSVSFYCAFAKFLIKSPSWSTLSVNFLLKRYSSVFSSD